MGARGPPGRVGPEGLRGIPGPVVSGAGIGWVGLGSGPPCVGTFLISYRSWEGLALVGVGRPHWVLAGCSSPCSVSSQGEPGLLGPPGQIGPPGPLVRDFFVPEALAQEPLSDHRMTMGADDPSLTICRSTLTMITIYPDHLS